MRMIITTIFCYIYISQNIAILGINHAVCGLATGHEDKSNKNRKNRYFSHFVILIPVAR